MRSALSALRTASLPTLFLLLTSGTFAAALHDRTLADFVSAEGGEAQYDDECVTFTSWTVLGLDIEFQVNGPPTPVDSFPGLIVTAESYRVCQVVDECGAHPEFQFLYSLLGLVERDQVTIDIDNQLNSAHLEATADFTDFATGEIKPIHVQLDAVGNGPIVHGHNIESFTEMRGGTKIRTSSHASTRDADVQVSIQDAQGTELATGRVFDASISTSAVTDLEIQHP